MASLLLGTRSRYFGVDISEKVPSWSYKLNDIMEKQQVIKKALVFGRYSRIS